MSPRTRLLALSGSARQESLNKMLVHLAARYAERAGAEVTIVDFADLPMPIFDEDLEAAQGMPENASRFKKLLQEHQGILIASPEYNSSVTPLLKNAIDWASRREQGEPPLVAFAGKVAGLLSASAGPHGGLRGLMHLRSILSNLKLIVIPEQAIVPNAGNAFDPDGDLTDSALAGRVDQVARGTVTVTARLFDPGN
jgi:NAD(P)H-dependent FMN reductase